MNDVLNYTDFALESSIESLRLMNKHRLVHLALESEFILECIDCGVLSPVFEADKANTVFSRATAAIKNFFQKVFGLFRTRSKEKAEKYVPWIKANVDSIKERSQNMTIELTPYWKSKWQEDIKQMTNVANKIFDNIKNSRFNDYSFANELVKIEGSVSETPNLKEKLIVRLSIGEKDKTSMEQVKIDKFGQTNIIEDMLKYILDYASEVPNALSQLEKTIERKMDQVAPKSITIKESNFFDIEQAPLCETDLVTLINYMEVITEGNNPKNTNDKNNGTVDSNGEKTSDTSVKVNPDGDDGKGTPEDNKNGDSKENESNEERDNYISECESFLKTMVTSFLTVAEKRFVVYTNTMVAIGGGQGRPTKDEDGNVEDKGQSKEESKEEPKEEKNKESIGSKLVKGIKNAVSKRKNKSKNKQEETDVH